MGTFSWSFTAIFTTLVETLGLSLTHTHTHTHTHTCSDNKARFYADLRSLHHLTYSLVGSWGKHCLSCGKCLQTVSSRPAFSDDVWSREGISDGNSSILSEYVPMCISLSASWITIWLTQLMNDTRHEFVLCVCFNSALFMCHTHLVESNCQFRWNVLNWI